jgi:hypothetical protein
MTHVEVWGLQIPLNGAVGGERKKEKPLGKGLD